MHFHLIWTWLTRIYLLTVYVKFTHMYYLVFLVYMYTCVLVYWGRAVAQWLRHYATNRQVAGSIPDGVIEIFQWHNPSGRTMAQRSIQPVT